MIQVNLTMESERSPAKEEESGVPALLNKKEVCDFWLQTIRHFYPDRQRRPYCVPPVFFKRVPYDMKHVAEQRVLVPLSSYNGLHVPAEGDGQSLELQPFSGSISTDEGGDTTPTAGRVWSGMSDQADPPLLRVSDSDMRSDDAQEQVLGCLMEFFSNSDQASRSNTSETEEHKAALIMSELDFLDYLNEEHYAAAAQVNEKVRFPRARDKKYFRNGRGGDFDVLVIHRHRGILAGEIKSVGSWSGGAQDEDDDKATKKRRDSDVAHKVKKAAEQMKKSENLINYLLSDLEFKPPIKMTLILPSIKRCHLQEILEKKENKKTLEALCKGLGLKPASAKCAVDLCLCEDEMKETTPSLRMDRMWQWWDLRMPGGNNCSIGESQYDEIFARFCGPATTVFVRCITRPRLELRTLGQAVSELGERLSSLILTYRQLELLSSRDRLVLLTGPPGTGKTVVLTLRGLQWLQEGHTVHVVSTRPASYGVSSLVANHLKQSSHATPPESHDGSAAAIPRVVLHYLDFYEAIDMEAVLKMFEEKAENGHLYIIADEYGSGDGDKAKHYRVFVEELQKRVPYLHFWTAVLRRGWHDANPIFKEEMITDPLRSAPLVQKEVQKGFSGLKDVYPYSSVGIPSPSDGPEVIHLQHGGEGHQGTWPTDCRQCGRNIGDKLRELGVGVEENNWPTSGIPSPSAIASVETPAKCQSQPCDSNHSIRDSDGDNPDNDFKSCTTAGDLTSGSSSSTLATAATPTTTPATPARGKGVRRPEPLHFRDVFVLTNSFDVKDDAESGHVNDVVVGMREAGMEVRVVQSMTKDPDGWKRDVVDTATAVTDQVTFSHMGDVSGLERKVVVWLPSLREGMDTADFALKDMGCLYAISRCIVQAIVVDVIRDLPTS